MNNITIEDLFSVIRSTVAYAGDPLMYLQAAFKEATDKAIENERSAVVAALRRTSNDGPMGLSLVNLNSIADAIERGEHHNIVKHSH